MAQHSSSVPIQSAAQSSIVTEEMPGSTLISVISRLGPFGSRYLRAIFGIQPAYVSRVSNQRVLERARQQPYSQQLLKQQLLLFGKIARAPRTDSLRKLTVCHLSLRPAASTYVRRVGRPRSEWAAKLREHALRIANDAVIAHPAKWRAAINAHFLAAQSDRLS